MDVATRRLMGRRSTLAVAMAAGALLRAKTVAYAMWSVEVMERKTDEQLKERVRPIVTTPRDQLIRKHGWEDVRAMAFEAYAIGCILEERVLRRRMAKPPSFGADTLARATEPGPRR